jgi:uncharacterized protein (TIGR02594 family)
MATLKIGDKGPEVRKLQTLLNSALGPAGKLKVDGHFGHKTHEAVIQFQRLKALQQDGIVGPRTWTALGQKVTTSPKVPKVGSPIGAPWMQIAEDELGIHEDGLPGSHNQRILAYHQTTTLRATTDETPWCAAFVNWVMIKAGYRGTNNALARSWLDWGQTLDQPREGAITIIKKKGATIDQATGSTTGFHVGFCVSATLTLIRLLGGNQGDQVKYSNFSLNSWEVHGYRWPT